MDGPLWQFHLIVQGNVDLLNVIQFGVCLTCKILE